MQFQEWQKILVTALAAFFVGLVAEPLKLWITEIYKKRKVRRLCYKRILVIRDALSGVLKGLKKPHDEYVFGQTGSEYARLMVPNINIGILKYAMENEGAIFYQLDVAMTVVRIVHTLEGIDDDTPVEKIEHVAKSIVHSIDHDVDWNQISGKYLLI